MRYNNEVRRIFSIEGALSSNPNTDSWLVGGKITYADLAFVPCNDKIDVLTGVSRDKKFEGVPNVKAWHERMTGRPSWKKSVVDEQGLQWNGMPKGINNLQDYEAKIKANKKKKAENEENI